MEGEAVHTWETEYNGGSVYMLDNGNIICEVREPEPIGEFTAGGEGGIIQEIAWDGTVVWEFKYSTEEYRHHHDIAPLPNGNVLLIVWERKTFDEAIEAGISPVRFEEEATSGRISSSKSSPCTRTAATLCGNGTFGTTWCRTSIAASPITASSPSIPSSSTSTPRLRTASDASWQSPRRSSDFAPSAIWVAAPTPTTARRLPATGSTPTASAMTPIATRSF